MIEERSLSSVKQAEDLIKSCGLTVNYDVDYTVGIFQANELLATGSLCGDMIQMLAVSSHHQGEDLSAVVITHLIKYALAMGRTSLFLFTRPEKTRMLQPLGFNVVASAKPYAILLEWGKPGIKEYLQSIKSQIGEVGDNVSAIVMNCNPFTLGHRYLIEEAAAYSKRVIIFVVQEDLSIFPFDVRYRLICEGTAHLSNVSVIAGGRYVISSLTFPSYFTKDTEHVYAHSAVDVEIFSRHIAPALSITKRYVGTEPYSFVTKIYNETMKKRLTPAEIEVVELSRLEKSGAPISASRVRLLLTQNNMTAVKELVPKTTYDFLTSEDAIPILKKLQD